MTIDVIQNAVNSTVTTPGYQVIQSPSGPQGPAAMSGLLFGFAGPLAANEPGLPGTMPMAGTFSAANSSTASEVAASGTAVFLIYMRPTVDGALALYATATFTPAGGTVTFAGSGAYPAGAYFKCLPPATPDASLFGPAILLGGP